MIRKKVEIARYDLLNNTSTCPAKEMKKIINNRTLIAEYQNPEYEGSRSGDYTSECFSKRTYTIDKEKAVAKLSNITVDNVIMNIETGEEVKADYVYNENHFIRLYVYADVEIINEQLANEYGIALDNIKFSGRHILETIQDVSSTRVEEIIMLKYISTWDVAKESNFNSQVQDILYASQEHRLLDR